MHINILLIIDRRTFYRLMMAAVTNYFPHLLAGHSQQARNVLVSNQA